MLVSVELIDAIVCASKCCNTTKCRITTGVVCISWWVVWGQTNSVSMHTRQALVLPTSTKQTKVKHLPCYHIFIHRLVTIIIELQLPPMLFTTTTFTMNQFTITKLDAHKKSNQCRKRKKYSCCEKIIKIACKCGIDRCNCMC